MAITRITKGVIKPNENYDTHNIVSTGIITSVGADINGDLDVDGHTNLDNVSISGVTTFSGSVNNLVLSGVVTTTGLDVNGNADISGNMSVGGVLTYEDVTSIDSIGIITARNDIHVGAGVSAVGVGTFGSLDIGGDIDVDGHTELDNLNVAGVTTFNDNVHLKTNDRLRIGNSNELEIYQQGNNTFILNNDDTFVIGQQGSGANHAMRIYGGSTLELKHMYGNGGQQFLLNSVRGAQTEIYNAGVKKFETSSTGITVTGTVVATGADINGDIDVDGHTNLDNVSIAGVTTFAGAIDLNADLDVDGHTNLDNVNVAGITTTTGHIYIKADNKRLFVGNDYDIQIYNDGSNSYLQNINGQLIIRSPLLAIQSSAYNQIIVRDAAEVELFYKGVMKLETASSGISVVGTTTSTQLAIAGVSTFTGAIDANGDLDVDGHTNLDNVSIAGVTTTTGDLTVGSGGENSALGVRFNSAYAQIKLPDGQTGANRKGNLSFGDNDDFRIVHDGHHNYITAGTGSIFVSTSSANPVNISNSSVDVNVDLTLTDTATDSAAGPELKLFRNSASPADADYLGQIKFAGESDTGVERNYAKITGKILDASNGTEDGILEFAHIKAGSQVITGRWRSDSLQLLNGTALTVAGSTTVTGNIIPSSDSATDIGTNSVRFANIYADTLYGDGSNLTGVTSVGGNTGVDFNDNVKARFGNTNDLVIYYENGGADRGKIGTVNNRPLDLLTNNTQRIVIENSGHVRPAINNSYDLGTGGDRWRNVYGVGGNFSGTVTANAFSGDGSNLTGLSVGIAGISTTGTSVFNNVTVSGISTINSLIVENYDGSGNSGIMTVPWKLGQSYSGGGAGGGTSNQVWGQFAGQNLSLSAAVQNVIIGREAAKGLDRGDSNVFIGCQAGPYNDGNNYENCDNNTVVSGYSMYFAGGNAKGNSVFGYHASYDLRGAQFNTTVGYAAAKNVMNGGECVVIGHSAAEGSSAYHPNSLVAIGASAAKNITSAQNVIVIGNNASPSSNTPSNEITLGDSDINHFRVPGIGVSFSAGGGVVTGIMTASSFKLLDGSAVGGVESDAQGNTVAGSGAGDSFTGTDAENNTLFGKDAGTAITSADSTTAVGKDAGKSITTGSYNHLFGIGAGDAITTGYNNTIMGHYAGSSFQTASENTIIGGNAGGGSSLGSRNVIVGKSCNQNNEGSNNVFIGQGAIAYRSGTASNNVIIGQAAADFLTNGNHNAGVGQNVFDDISTGSDNSALGSNAGDTLTTGSNNLFLGHDAFPSSATVSNEVTIGDSNITKFRVPGINFILKDNGGTPTQGHVLTVDGNGEAGFAAVSADVVNDSSPQLGGDLASNGNDILMADNDQIKLGSSNDFTMYHDSSGHTFLQDQGNGALRIRSDSEVAIQSYVSGTNKNMAKFMPDGTVELYHNGNKKLHTFDSGVVITGDAQWMDNHDAQFGNSADLKIYHNGTHNYFLATNGDYVFDNGSSELARISQSGNFTASGFIDSTSDIKLKTNIKTIDNALDKVLQLRGAEYDRIDRDNQHEIGVIAQEVEKIIPEVVHGEDTKTVSYGNMVAVLIEAIKEQNEVINKMKKEIEDLKG